MAEKDITERGLEWYNEVFADIVNAWFVIQGIKGFEVRPEELTETRARTAYKADGELRERERDVAKLWRTSRGKSAICLLGMENQTGIDTYMALRVLGYDGGDYTLQLRPQVENGKRRRKKPHPVLTLVLYFGTWRRWPRRRSVLDRLNVSEELRPYFSDTPLNVFELAFLTEEQEGLFKSDFKHVVHYLRQERLGQKFEMLPDEVQHATELLDLLFSLTKDPKFKDAIRKAQIMDKKGEPMNMRSFLSEAKAEGRAEERRDIRDILIAGGMKPQELQERLMAGGMSPQEAASFAGLSV